MSLRKVAASAFLAAVVLFPAFAEESSPHGEVGEPTENVGRPIAEEKAFALSKEDEETLKQLVKNHYQLQLKLAGVEETQPTE